MDATIRQMRVDHGCRLFVLSLGDVHANLPRGRVGPWAATLDELARELDILIIVSAGNRAPRARAAPRPKRPLRSIPTTFWSRRTG
jgi:hypothetical protein